MTWLAQIGGVALILLALTDIYLTVLYARAGSSLISERLSRWTFLSFRAISSTLPRQARGCLLSFSGPTILVLLVVVWVSLLTIGFACIVWAHLATFSAADGHPIAHRFVNAYFFSGTVFTTATSGEPRPNSGFFKVMAVIESVIGMSVITMTLTYFLQIYTALQRRNVLAMGLQAASSEQGDAVELIAGLGPGGDFSEARSELMRLGDELRTFYESHHFYPSLLYFRFQEPHHTPGGITLTLLDATTLIECALSDERHRNLKRSGAVEQLRRSGLHLLKELSKTYLQERAGQNAQPDIKEVERWRERFRRALVRLREVGISTVTDERAGEEAYVAGRKEWSPYIDAFLDHLGRD